MGPTHQEKEEKYEERLVKKAQGMDSVEFSNLPSKLQLQLQLWVCLSVCFLILTLY